MIGPNGGDDDVVIEDPTKKRRELTISTIETMVHTTMKKQVVTFITKAKKIAITTTATKKEEMDTREGEKDIGEMRRDPSREHASSVEDTERLNIFKTKEGG